MTLDKNVLMIETKGVLYGVKRRTYSTSNILKLVDLSQTAFDVTFQVKDRSKKIGLRFSNVKDKARWMVGILLNIRGPLESPSLNQTNSNPSRGTNNTNSSTTVQTKTKHTRRRVSTISNMSELSPNPEWLVGAGTRGPSYWKDHPCDERSSKHTPEVLAFASQLGKYHISLTFKRGWPWAAWGVNILQQILEMTRSKSEDQAIISRSRSQVITPTFFVALLTINGKIKEKEKLYQQVVKTFRDYQHKVVIPSIRNHSNFLKEFVRSVFFFLKFYHENINHTRTPLGTKMEFTQNLFRVHETYIHRFGQEYGRSVSREYFLGSTSKFLRCLGCVER